MAVKRRRVKPRQLSEPEPGQFRALLAEMEKAGGRDSRNCADFVRFLAYSGYERPGGGRGFGFTGMHTHWTWAQDSFRKSVLNALAWIAGAEVPADGVPSKTPTLEELESDPGMPRPPDFNADATREVIEAMNQ